MHNINRYKNWRLIYSIKVVYDFMDYRWRVTDTFYSSIDSQSFTELSYSSRLLNICSLCDLVPSNLAKRISTRVFLNIIWLHGFDGSHSKYEKWNFTNDLIWVTVGYKNQAELIMMKLCETQMETTEFTSLIVFMIFQHATVFSLKNSINSCERVILKNTVIHAAKNRLLKWKGFCSGRFW